MMARMTQFPRACALAAWLLMTHSVFAQAPATAQPASPQKREAAPQASALNAELFYQLLLGELAVRSDDPGSAFSLMLDAARKTEDPAVYQRAVEIALQARSGESALQAARAWKQAHPKSRDANRFVLQILLALNRVGETAEPLKAELALVPSIERNTALALVPRLYARASDRKQAASVVEQAVAPYLTRPESASAAWTCVGRMRLGAEDPRGALEAARHAQAADPAAEGPALLALEIMGPDWPQAEALVRTYLAAKPLPEIRMAYVRALLDAQRLADAEQQLQALTRQNPEYGEAWLVQGVLQVQEGKLDAGEASLKRFLSLVPARASGESPEGSRAQAQAYLALAQVAEKRGDLPAAGRWLDQIKSPQDLVATQTRRAALLARQGRMDQARQLIRDLPERKPEDARSKLLSEAHLLRDFKQHQASYDLLAQALARAPQDAELLYEQAMAAEKLERFAEMEKLLRQAIAAKPDSPAAYNALGYALADRNQRLPEARQLIRKALDLAPGDPFITDSLGWVEFRLDNKAEAARLLEQAFKSRPDAEIAAHLGEVLWSLGQKDRALATWREGLRLNADNETLRETLKRLQVQP